MWATLPKMDTKLAYRETSAPGILYIYTCTCIHVPAYMYLHTLSSPIVRLVHQVILDKYPYNDANPAILYIYTCTCIHVPAYICQSSLHPKALSLMVFYGILKHSL